MTATVLPTATIAAASPTGAAPEGPPAFLPGEVLAQRFEVRRFLGQGGMGQIFETFDRELGDRVALKALRPEIASSPRAAAAFRREVSLARRVTHPNVCRIFELLRHPAEPASGWGRERRPALFLTMELLRGETLAERLRRGPLPVEEVLAYARQLAAALDAAHDAGVVHRDLKSSNIFLADDRLVVTDFGLARPDVGPREEKAVSTAVSGTPGYMAPELLAGRPATAASDVYAFGVVVYEMLRGQRPATDRAPEPPSHSCQDWPSFRDSVLLRCLDQRPERRFRRAGDAITALAPSRRRTLLPAILMILFALFGGSFLLHRWLPQEPLTAVAAPRPIVLGNLDNRTGESRFDDGIGHAFRVALEQSPRVRVLSSDSVRQALQRMQRDPSLPIDREVGLEISLREGAEALVLAHLDGVGSRYLLSASVLDPRTGRQVFGASAAAAEPGDVLDAIDTVVRDLRRGLGETLASIDETSEPLQKVTTANLDALRLYSLGSDKLDLRLLEEAIPLLRQSLKLDPELAMAHAKLAAAYRFQGHGHAATAGHLRRALELEHRLTGFEKRYVQAWVASLEAAPDAVADWALLSHLYPAQGLGHYNLGMAYVLFEQRWDLAIAALVEAARHDTGALGVVVLDRLGSGQLALEEIDEALVSFQSSRQAAEYPMAGLGAGLCAAGRHQEGRQALAASFSHPSPRYRLEALLVLAACRADEGRLNEALTAVDTAAGLAEAVGPAVAGAVDLARLALLLDSPDVVAREKAVQTAAEFAEALLSSRGLPPGSLPVPRLAVLGKLLARAGAVDRAQRLLAALEPVADRATFTGYKASTALLRGELELAHDRPEEAVRWLERSLAFAESVQVHDSLARAAAVLGDRDFAARHRRWVVEHPGRMFAERAVDESLPVVNVLSRRSVTKLPSI